MADPTQVQDLVAQAGGPSGMAAIAAAVTALLAVLAQLRSLRRESGERYRDLDARAKAVAFWETWYKAQVPISTAVELAHARVLVKKRLDELADAQLPKLPFETFVTNLRRVLLLRPAPTGWVWVARSAFYVVLFMLVATSVTSVLDAMGNRFSWPLAIGLAAGLIIAASVTRALALFVEVRAMRSQGASA